MPGAKTHKIKHFSDDRIMKITTKSFYTIMQMFGVMDGVLMTVIILALATAAMVVVYIMLALMKKSKLKKLQEKIDPKEDAYNKIQILKSMVRVMKEKNYNTAAVENMILKAEGAYNNESYAECIEIVNNAKRILIRLKEENAMEDHVSPQVAKEMEIIKKIESSPDSGEVPTPLRELEKELPENFLQSKFEIRVVERKIGEKEDGEIKEAAILYLSKAKNAFENKDYTEALRLAVKGNRILETGEISEENPQVSENTSLPKETKEVVPIVEAEDEKEEKELHCPNCGAVVRAEDKFCWNCGAKLVYTYKCPNCGAEVSSEDKFCRNCGYKLK